MRAFITGGAGFVGQWLIRELLSDGANVHVAGLHASDGPRGVLSEDERSRARWIPADFRDADAVGRAVAVSEPDVVFHLAAIAFPPDADRSPADAYDVNTLGVVRLLTALRALGANPTTLVIGTAVQYGQHALDEMPLRESASQCPASVYAASKAAQEIASLQFFHSTGARVICTRSFNHSGPGNGAQYLIPSLVARGRRVARGEDARVTLGNDVVRDYLHVVDVVRAYVALALRGTPGQVYNVCSGVGVSARKLADEVLLQLGVTAEISTEPSLVRASDIPVLVGSPEKLMRDTGWAPTRTHTDIIADLLNASTD